MQESEKELQENFINNLKNQGFEYVELKNEDELLFNFKEQLQSFNNTHIENFDEILNYLCEGVCDFKFEKLRNSFNDIRFIDFSDFSANIFQVSEEITISGEYTNRYDVTILVNGLPLVQIELKRSGVNLQEAFNQIKRYSKHSFSNLFDYVQLFVISNKVHTRYFFNDPNVDYNLTYVWKDSKDLESFTNSFLDKNNILNIISKFIFKDLISNEVKMLRPYQIDAIDAVFNQIKRNENAYLWMSFNTGKTLTSLRLAQLLKEDYKVIYLTTNHLSKYPQSFTVKSQKKLMKILKRKNFVITNIRTLLSLKEKLESIKDEKIIFILNEYEKYNVKYDPLILKDTFKNSLFYCFTSAPIFDDNLINDETTKFIFDNKIYTYSFKNALNDKNNLVLDLEYVDDTSFNLDFNYSSKSRIKEISNYILDNFSKKTMDGEFQSIVFTSSNFDLVEYYSNLKDSNLNIVPILRYDSNDVYNDVPLRDYFEKFVLEYNDIFNANIEYKKVVDTTKISEQLESDIINRFNNGEIDLLLIDESMLKNKYKLNLLGNLKNPKINTIYLDCNLNYESLLEVLTMVNEVGTSKKTNGNIVTFRDVRNDIDDALKLFSNNDASEIYRLKPYNYYLRNYNDLIEKINKTDDFIRDYEELSNNYYIMERFEDFDFKQAQIDEFNQYKDRYNHEKYRLKSSKKFIPKFNLKLVDHYTINTDYIDDLLLDKIKHEEKTLESNEITHNITQEFNNTSNELNINDSSKNVNINELHIHITPQAEEKVIETHLATDMVREKVAVSEISHDNIEVAGEPEIAFEDNQEYKIKIDVEDQVYNVKFELNRTNLAPNSKKISANECNHCGRRYDLKTNFCNYDVGVELFNSDDFKKVCPQCGMKYPESENYCHYHSGVKLMNIDNFPKICPKCGRRYSEEYNFCQEDIGVRLVTKKDLVKFCPNCGAKYPKNEFRCSRCHENLELEDIIDFRVKDIEFNPNPYYNMKTHENNIEHLSDLFTSENIYKLSTFTFSREDYEIILNSIINIHKLILDKLIMDYDIDFDELSTLDKVLLYAKTFVKVKFKQSGNDLGRFVFNNIFLDDRKPGTALEITTIIHELSHFLISEIFEQIIMEVLDTNKSDVIESFVCFVLVKNNFNKLLDEFSAHSVESMYTQFGYQNFSSYKDIYYKITQSGEYSEDEVELARYIGNSFANDIKIIFSQIIDEELRESIIDEFKNMENPNYEDMSLETDVVLSFDDFLSVIKAMIMDVMENIQTSDLDKLQEYVLEFEKNNN